MKLSSITKKHNNSILSNFIAHQKILTVLFPGRNRSLRNKHVAVLVCVAGKPTAPFLLRSFWRREGEGRLSSRDLVCVFPFLGFRGSSIGIMVGQILMVLLGKSVARPQATLAMAWGVPLISFVNCSYSNAV
jgi:hypothetical protein